jgi:hypothetical protein
VTAEELLGGLLPLITRKSGEFLSALKEEDGQFKEDAIEQVKELASQHIQQQYKRGRKERGKEYEHVIRRRFPDLEGDLQGDDLVNAIPEPTPPREPSEGEFDLDATMARPEVQQRIRAISQKATETIAKEKQALEQKLAETASAYDRKERQAVLDRYVLERAAAHNIPLSVKGDDALTAKRQRTLRRLLNVDEFTISDGIPVPVDEKGEPRHDENGLALTFDDVLLEVNPFSVATYNNDTEDTPPPGGGGTSKKLKYKFTDGAQFVKERERAIAEGRREEARQMSADYAAAQQG